MKTEELIEGIKYWSNLLKNNFDLRTNLRNPTDKILWYDYRQKDDEFVSEVIKRLEELEKLKTKLKEIKMKDYVGQALIEKLPA